MPRYDLVLFDLDGTLIDSAPDLGQAVNRALAERDLPSQEVPAVRRMIGEGQRVLIERAVRTAMTQRDGREPDGDTVAALADLVLPRFRLHYSEHLVETTRPYPTVVDTLARLPAALPRGVATNKPGVWARRIAEALGLSAHLGGPAWILGEDDIGRRKPDPALLLLLCERAAVAPARALYVGDSLIDLKTAQAAGMDLALCRYGYLDADTRAALAAGSPPGPVAYELDELAQLLPIISA